MSAIRVRPGEPRDLAGIVAIYNHYVTHTATTFEIAPVRVEDRAAWLESRRSEGPHRIWVAADGDDRVVGWATTSPFRPRAGYATTVEASVYCHPTSVGQGVGTRLYAALFRSVEGEDLERIVAGVALPNPASLALHHRFGFRTVGVFTRVGRKFGQYWDVAWFERPVRIEGAVPGEEPASLAYSSETSDLR